MPVGCLGNTSSTDQKDLRNHSISGSHLEEGGGNGNINQVKTIKIAKFTFHIIQINEGDINLMNVCILILF